MAARGLGGLKPYAHFADKYDDGDYQGPTGTYKLMYALGNLIRTNGVAGLIFDEEINHDMAHSLDATDEERKEHLQGLESAAHLRRLTRQFRRVSIVAARDGVEPGLATLDDYPISDDDDDDNNLGDHHDDHSDEQRHELPHQRAGGRIPISVPEQAGSRIPISVPEAAQDGAGAAAAPESKTDVNGSVDDAFVQVAPAEEEPGSHVGASAGPAGSRPGHQFRPGQEVMYRPPGRGEEEMPTRARVVAILQDGDRGLFYYKIERLMDGHQGQVPEQHLSAADGPARASSARGRSEPPAEGKRDAPQGDPGRRAAGGAEPMGGGAQGVRDQLHNLHDAVRLHEQLEQQRLAANEARLTAHKNNIRSLKEQQMLSSSITTSEGFMRQPRTMRIALYDKGNAYIARILIMVLGEHGRAIVDDISHSDGMAIKRAMQNYIESEFEDPIAHARSQLQSIRQDSGSKTPNKAEKIIFFMMRLRDACRRLINLMNEAAREQVRLEVTGMGEVDMYLPRVLLPVLQGLLGSKNTLKCTAGCAYILKDIALPRIVMGLARRYKGGRNLLKERMAESLDNGQAMTAAQQISKLIRWEKRHTRELQEAWKKGRERSGAGGRHGPRSSRRHRDTPPRRRSSERGQRPRRERANLAQPHQGRPGHHGRPRNSNPNSSSRNSNPNSIPRRRDGQRPSRTKEERRCWNCDEVGHLSFQCPHPRRDGGQQGGRPHQHGGRPNNHRGRPHQYGGHATMVREPEFHDIYHMVETIGPNYSEEPIPDEEKPACNHGQGGHAGERVGEATHPGPQQDVEHACCLIEYRGPDYSEQYLSDSDDDEPERLPPNGEQCNTVLQDGTTSQDWRESDPNCRWNRCEHLLATLQASSASLGMHGLEHGWGIDSEDDEQCQPHVLLERQDRECPAGPHIIGTAADISMGALNNDIPDVQHLTSQDMGCVQESAYDDTITDWQVAADRCMAGSHPQPGEMSEYSDDEFRWECNPAAPPWDQDQCSRCPDPVGDQLDDDNMPVEVNKWWDASEAFLRDDGSRIPISTPERPDQRDSSQLVRPVPRARTLTACDVIPSATSNDDAPTTNGDGPETAETKDEGPMNSIQHGSSIPNPTPESPAISDLTDDIIPLFNTASSMQAYNATRLIAAATVVDSNTFTDMCEAAMMGAEDNAHSLPSALATFAAIDTGASKTYVGQHEKLVNRKLIRGATVKAADGREMSVLQDGTWHQIDNTRMLSDLDQNLISPQQVARQHGVMWIVRKDTMTMAPDEPMREDEVHMADINRNGLFVCNMRKLDDALLDMSSLRGGGIPKPNLNRNFYRQPYHAQGMAYGAKMRVTDMVRLLHERMGHMSLPKLKSSLEQGMRTGMNVSPAAVQREYTLGFRCLTCELAKATQSPEPTKSGHIKTSDILGVIHTDTAHRNVTSIRGNKYSQLMIDENTHMFFNWNMKRKSDIYGVLEEATSTLELEAKRSVQAEFRRIKLKLWRTNGDGMFRSQALKELFL